MKPVTEDDRDDLLRKRDVTTPLKVTIDFYSGRNEGKLEERDKQASVTILRCYMGAGVTRHEVESHRFYGTLFLPPGEGQFPGIYLVLFYNLSVPRVFQRILTECFN